MRTWLVPKQYVIRVTDELYCTKRYKDSSIFTDIGHQKTPKNTVYREMFGPVLSPLPISPSLTEDQFKTG